MGQVADETPPAREDIAIADVLGALADPTRLAMVRALAEAGGELSCSSLRGDVSASTASHHLGILRRAGLLETRQSGASRLNGLRRDDLEARFPGLLAAVVDAETGLRGGPTT